MLKIERLMKERGISPYKLGYYSGSPYKMNGLKKAIDGKVSISSLPYDTLETVSRILGLSINEILEDFEENGVSGQIETVQRNVDRIRYKMETETNETVKDKGMILQARDNLIKFTDSDLIERLSNLERFGKKNKSEQFGLVPGFIFAINCNKLEEIPSSFQTSSPFLKTEFDFINTGKLNSNSKSISELNRDYLDYMDGPKDNKRNILKERKNYIGNSPTLFIYTPLENGGDLKVVVSVLDYKGNFTYTDLYGCEWLDSNKKKDIVYYKSQYNQPFNPTNIQNCHKERISEVEFNVSLQSQFSKFGIGR